jgi:hypothetical protein
MDFSFSANMWEWRGPAPFYFLSLPIELADEIKAAVSVLSYGWGMIPVIATIQGREFKTSMFSKNGMRFACRSSCRLMTRLKCH